MAAAVTYLLSSYAVSDVKTTWPEASASCRKLGAELVKIESQGETEFLNSTFDIPSLKKIWIGLNDIDEEGVWKWSDGTSLPNYTNWGANEPNNHQDSQHCVLVMTGLMVDHDFNAK